MFVFNIARIRRLCGSTDRQDSKCIFDNIHDLYAFRRKCLCAQCLLVQNAVKVSSFLSSDFSKATKPLCAPAILGAPSVAIVTRWVVFISLALKQSSTASQMSSPRVLHFSVISSTICSCGPAEFTYWQNSAICSLSPLSLDSSQAIE